MPTRAPRALGRSALVMEVDVDRSAPAQWVRITVSRPGTDGTLSRTWEAPGGVLSESVATDLTFWWCQFLLEALTLGLGGVQLQFP